MFVVRINFKKSFYLKLIKLKIGIPCFNLTFILGQVWLLPRAADRFQASTLLVSSYLQPGLQCLCVSSVLSECVNVPGVCCPPLGGSNIHLH